MEQAPMESELRSLEQALRQAELEATGALSVVTKLQLAVKSCRRATQVGDLKGLRKCFDTVRDNLGRVVEKLEALPQCWPHSEADEELYFAEQYTKELLDVAREAELGLYEQDQYLACYPSLLKVQPKDRTVSIDRKTHRAVRPSMLVAHLSRLQKGAARFNAAQFLATLHKAYNLVAREGSGVQKLIDVYEALTLLPSARREYSLQEFARDVYLLDACQDKATSDGRHLRLHPGATGSKTRKNLLVVVTREGVERTYYGVEFI